MPNICGVNRDHHYIRNHLTFICLVSDQLHQPTIWYIAGKATSDLKTQWQHRRPSWWLKQIFSTLHVCFLPNANTQCLHSQQQDNTYSCFHWKKRITSCYHHIFLCAVTVRCPDGVCKSVERSELHVSVRRLPHEHTVSCTSWWAPVTPPCPQTNPARAAPIPWALGKGPEQNQQQFSSSQVTSSAQAGSQSGSQSSLHLSKFPAL